MGTACMPVCRTFFSFPAGERRLRNGCPKANVDLWSLQHWRRETDALAAFRALRISRRSARATGRHSRRVRTVVGPAYPAARGEIVGSKALAQRHSVLSSPL